MGRKDKVRQVGRPGEEGGRETWISLPRESRLSPGRAYLMAWPL